MNEDIRAYKYQVTFNMQKVSIAIGFRCKIMIVIRKGKQKFESQSKIPLDNAKFEAKFNETIKFDSIYLKDMKTGKYLEEKNQVTIVIVTHKGNKTAGVFTLKPADYLNQGKMASVREASALQRCPDKKARCYYGLSFMRIKELTIEELQEEREQNPNITVVEEIDFTMLQSLNMSDDLQKKLDGVDDGYRGGDMLGGLSSDRERPKAHDCSKHAKNDDCDSLNKYDRSFKRKRSSGVIKMKTKLTSNGDDASSPNKTQQQPQVVTESEDVAFAKKLLFAKDENLMVPEMQRRTGDGRTSRSTSRSFNKNQNSGEKGSGVKVKFKKKDETNDDHIKRVKEEKVKNLMMLQSFGPENPKNNILPLPNNNDDIDDIQPETIFDVEDSESGMELLDQLGMEKPTKSSNSNPDFLKEIELLKEENDHLTKAYESLKNEKNKTISQSNLFQNELMSLQEEIKALRIENHEIKIRHEEEIENKDSEISDHKIETGALKKHNDMLKKQKKQLEDAQESLRAEKANDSEISFQLKKKIQECQDLQNEKNLALEQLKVVKLANVQFEIEIAKLQNENEEQKNEISNLKNLVEEEKTVRKKLEQEKYAGGIEDQEHVDKTIGELKAKLKETQKQNRELEEAQDELKKQLENEKTEKNEISEQLMDLETEHSEKVIELDDNIDNLEEQIQDLEDKIKELEELNFELVRKYF